MTTTSTIGGAAAARASTAALALATALSMATLPDAASAQGADGDLASPSVRLLGSGEIVEGTFISAYLGAQAALWRNDLASAALFYDRAAAFRPDDVTLLRDGMVYNLIVGRAGSAVALAERLRAVADEEPGGLARLLGVADAFARGDAEEALRALEDEALEGQAPEDLRRHLRAFALLDSGETERAADMLRDATATGPLDGYLLGLLLMAAGETSEARAVLDAFRVSTSATAPGLAWNARIVAATAIAQARDGDLQAARALVSDALERAPQLARLSALRAVLAEDDAMPRPPVADATEGAGEAFFLIAARLVGESRDRRRAARRALLFSQMGDLLAPGLDENRLLIGEQLIRIGQYPTAASIFAGVDAASPFAESALLGRVSALRRADDREGALAAVDAYLATTDANPEIHLERAALLQSLRRYDACAVAYEDGLARLDVARGGALRQNDWRPLFGHGVCLERLGRWPEAEAQFRAALALEPDQPSVLNYLGYSLVIKGQKLEEALELLRRAVELSPRSGHIVDSLGWALYTLGRFEEAVPQLERAAALEPTIAVVNDHLGDALWRVGRRNEARFHWRRALSLAAEEEETEAEPERIRAKLERGLDAVLAEERAAEERAREDAEAGVSVENATE